MFGDNLPAYGFYLRHVKNISLQQIQFNISGEEHRPALHIEDAENISINTCKIKIPANNQPVVRIIDTKGLLLSNLYDTQSPIPLLLETDGKNTGKIRIMNQEGGKGDNLVKSK